MPALPLPASQPLQNYKMAITDLTVEKEAFRVVGDTSTRAQATQSTLPRRSTLEFRIYYVVIVLAVLVMVKVPIELSSEQHPNYAIYARKLRQGWIAGRKIDISDSQYRQFRQGLPDLVLLAAVQVSGWHLTEAIFRKILRRNLRRVTYLACSSILITLVLHGINTFKILAIMAANLEIAKFVAGKRFAPLAIWTFNIAVLFGNETFNGYPFGILHPSLDFLDHKSLQGLIPRWHISFNITILRLISFALETHWARLKGEDITKDESKPKELYTAYILYTPLYIAGPVMLYDDFASQLKTPRSITLRQVISYAIRFIFCLLTMEFVLHFMYVVAIKDSVSPNGVRAWSGDSPMQLFMIGFWNLIVIWLKLLLPWRFFRLWALADGLNPPENMIRCMANNYSVMSFWRSWHRSYNLWLLRYIYVPLGGNKRPVLATLCVFTFVALWHDLTFRLLAWGWTVSIFVLPELLAKRYAARLSLEKKACYRHLAAAGGVINILLLLTANLIGFAIGVDGTRFLVGQLLSSVQGVATLLTSCAVLFCAVQVMFEYRSVECTWRSQAEYEQ